VAGHGDGLVPSVFLSENFPASWRAIDYWRPNGVRAQFTFGGHGYAFAFGPFTCAVPNHGAPSVDAFTSFRCSHFFSGVRVSFLGVDVSFDARHITPIRPSFFSFFFSSTCQQLTGWSSPVFVKCCCLFGSASRLVRLSSAHLSFAVTCYGFLLVMARHKPRT